MNYPFNQIRAVYEKWLPAIEKVLAQNERYWPKPYLMDWMNLMSPIEKQTWEALRFYGHVPMYPQLPSGPYFLDFANPDKKIAIECDGKAYHQNRAKDDERARKLFYEGWKIFRISGSDCMNVPNNQHYDYDHHSPIEEWEKRRRWFYMETIEGLIHALDLGYFQQPDYMQPYSLEEDDLEQNLIELDKKLAEECLQRRIHLPFE